ncbi:hypothetical protein BH09ACT1_BH09ACT1_01790 [soil metagenome]
MSNPLVQRVPEDDGAPSAHLSPAGSSVVEPGEGRSERATSRGRFHPDEFFGAQPSRRSELPNPEPLLENLTRCVLEILAGARDLDQIARWVTEDVYRHLLKRVVLSARARQASGTPVSRPSFVVTSSRYSEPRDGVIEAVLVVRNRIRTRSVAIRLEGLDNRWRAVAIHVL